MHSSNHRMQYHQKCDLHHIHMLTWNAKTWPVRNPSSLCITFAVIWTRVRFLAIRWDKMWWANRIHCKLEIGWVLKVYLARCVDLFCVILLKVNFEILFNGNRQECYVHRNDWFEKCVRFLYLFCSYFGKFWFNIKNLIWITTQT